MSLFGSLMGDLENDPFFGSHMRTMRHVNSMMNSILSDPFGDFMGMRDFGIPALTGSRAGSLMPFGGFPPMPNINRLLSSSFENPNAHCYSTSTVVSMTSGPDGRPHVYKATSSTRTAPGGLKETQKTVCDSRTGTKKMAIGHHIGERAHIIEREQNVETGDQEQREDFINLDEEEAEDFNQEWEQKTRHRPEISRITSARHRYGRDREHSGLPAITAGPASACKLACTNTSPQDRRQDKLSLPGHSSSSLLPRRSIRSRKQDRISPSSSHPYSPSGHYHSRKNKNIKSVSGSPTHDIIE
ncbi:myeloid leukemia factor isoform X2 [Agrilus planipennis]|uniref:Myeloid leukemia factor isoform X2 n=1 Tax=Agrilus planipennis TaxID=224129 RepID=A0A1W4WQX0_AGRPL|nr:myeloid leukemia factor isoform X2 [Agrilus planipennis]